MLCLEEDVTFDTGGDGLCVSFGRTGLAVITQVIRPESLERYVWAP
jgi:hypothetical protein